MLIFLFLFFSNVALANSIKEVIFFGDSLSDDGNLYQLIKVIPQSPPYYQGRFSNGPTWAEYLGKYFYDKFYAAYSNYCYGGATAILHKPRQDSFIAPVILEEELQAYFVRSARTDKSQTLYAIWIGANDYLYDRQPDIDNLTQDVIDKISSTIDALISKGGKNFLILNLPDLSKTPFAREENTVERLSQLSQLHNDKLYHRILTFKDKYPNVHFVMIDTYYLLNDLLSDPEKYNQKYHTHITDTLNSCWKGKWGPSNLSANNQTITINNITQPLDILIQQSPSLATAYQVGRHAMKDAELCTNPDEHVFWDILHPTAIVHQTLAQIIIESLTDQGLM